MGKLTPRLRHHRALAATLRAGMDQNLTRAEIKTNVRAKLDLFEQLRS